MPNDLPPWAVVYQQTQRWLAAGCFEALVDDLRAVLRLAAGGWRLSRTDRCHHRQPDVALHARERRARRL